ncbi:MAG: hypothetical protein EBV10_01435 [Synechococcaceae bacterium WB6_1A_059]|nr:hypothetical protein [Synechococcaceae bacterium WB6_1A_059]
MLVSLIVILLVVAIVGPVALPVFTDTVNVSAPSVNSSARGVMLKLPLAVGTPFTVVEVMLNDTELAEKSAPDEVTLLITAYNVCDA